MVTINKYKENFIITTSEQETLNLAKKIAKLLKPGDVISVSGELGTGKTCFVKGLAQGMGISQVVTSPSFVILKIYYNKIPLYHFDVYRLDKSFQLEEIGFQQFQYGDGITVVEWGDKVSEILAFDHLEINFYYYENDKRKIKITPHGESWERRLNKSKFVKVTD